MTFLVIWYTVGLCATCLMAFHDERGRRAEGLPATGLHVLIPAILFVSWLTPLAILRGLAAGLSSRR
jgi:hypothetical protein